MRPAPPARPTAAAPAPGRTGWHPLQAPPAPRGLPPIGCNGRGAQASSTAAPVSLQEPPLDEQFRLVAQAGVFDGFDRLPLDEAERAAFHAAMAQHGLPVHTASGIYALGRDEAQLPGHLARSAAVGARLHNMMVYWHDAAGRPVTDAEVAGFYARAWDLGAPLGVEPALELHVNMWSEDPRRVLPVAQRVQALGLPFNLTLDYSHVLFKLGNPLELAICGLTEDVAAGRVQLDPREPGNLVQQWLDAGLVRWLQVRAAAPNGPRNPWSPVNTQARAAGLPAHAIYPYRDGEPSRGILYPFAPPAPGEWHSPWDDTALDACKAVVRMVLRHHATEPLSRLAAITTEMINLPDYAHGARFSLIGQNAAIARFIRATWAEVAQAAQAPQAPRAPQARPTARQAPA